MIHLPIFKGRVPILPPRLLPQEYAQTAKNCDLSQGLLKSFYNVSATKTLTGLDCLDFDAQTGSFTVGNTITAAISGTTADSDLVFDNGTTGTLELSSISGSGFEDNEIIYESAVGSTMNSSSCENRGGANGYDTFDGESATGFHAVKTTGAGTTFYCGTADEITIVDGGYIIVTLTATLTSGEDPHCTLLSALDGSSVANENPAISAGANTLVFSTTSTTTGVLAFTNAQATEFTIASLAVKSITNAALVNGVKYSPDWRSIFPVTSSGTTFWLCSQQEAHFVHAPVYGSGIRFYYTDGVRPKESNYALASNSGANTYGDPYTSYYMGVPKPSAALTATVKGNIGTSGDLKLKDVTGTWANNEEIQISSTKYALVNGTISAGDYLSYDGLVAGLSFTINDDIVGGTSEATGTVESITETTTDSVSYIYTFITSWGYEGEPSDPTDVVDVGAGQYVELGNFETTVPIGYNIVGIRIYRTSTGSDETDFCFVSEAMTGASSDYITPAEIVANSNVWDDKDSTDNELTDADDLGEPISCDTYIEPPSALSGLLALPNQCVAAYRTREIYISEPAIHYGFPDDYVKKTHYDIKAIANYGNTIVAGTEGYPHKITGYDPQTMSNDRLPEKQACLYTRAMVSGPNFVLYPSPDGLYRIGETGNFITTKNVFTKEQWRTLLTSSTAYDKTIISFLYDGKYYAFFEGSYTGFIIDFESETQFYATFELDSSYKVYGGYVNLEDDKLYLLVYITDTYYIKEWEGDTAHLVYTWKSKVFADDYTFYSCMKVNGDIAADSTGTGTISATSTAVVGSGTAFTTELKVGYPVYNADNNEYREVSVITDNTHLTLSTAFTANFSAKAFKYNDLLLNLYRDNTLVYTRSINSTSPFRLPSGYGREWEIEIKGSDEVYDIKMGHSMSEL